MSGTTTGTSSAVEVTELGGCALKLQTDTPHLVSLGGGRLSTAVTLHPIPPGQITLGSGPGVDIVVNGSGVEPVHCKIENANGIVTLYPLADCLSVDGANAAVPTRLFQGVTLTIGHSNYMRFNHPAEAQLMKSKVTMATMRFEDNSKDYNTYNRKPSILDDFIPSSIQSKVSKFEYLAAQNFRQSISPKVFSSNLVTVNTPAKDVLGRAPPDLQHFAKNLPQSAVNYSDTTYGEKQKNKTPERCLFGRKSPQCVNLTLNDTKNTNSRAQIYENVCTPRALHNINMDQTPKPELNNMNNKLNNSMPTSAKTVNVDRVVSPTLPNIPSNISQEELLNKIVAERVEVSKSQAQTVISEKRNEHVLEKSEQAKLDEVLSLCAEYDKQMQWEKNNKPTPNRIITNGSLPRDFRSPRSPNIVASSPIPTPSQTSPSPLKPKDSPIFRYDSGDAVHVNKLHNYENVSLKENTHHYESVELKVPPYENVTVAQHYPSSPRTRIRTVPTSPKDNWSDKSGVDNKSNQLDRENRKPVTAKLIVSMDSGEEDKENSFSSKPSNSDNMAQICKLSRIILDERGIEALKHQKHDTMSEITNIKRQITNIEAQEDDLNKEVEIEKILVDAERNFILMDLKALEAKKQKLVARAAEIDVKMEDCQLTQAQHQEDCRAKLEQAQNKLEAVERQLSSFSKGSLEYNEAFENFLAAQEELDNERKTFEDLEFHHLEEEADWLASREEIQREIVDLTKRTEAMRDQVVELDMQVIKISSSKAQESHTLERHLIKNMRKLEDCRGRLKSIEVDLKNAGSRESLCSDTDSEADKAELSSNMSLNTNRDFSCSFIEMSDSKIRDDNVFNMSQSYDEKMLHEKLILDIGANYNRRFPSQDDIDRISKVTSDAPMNIEKRQAFLGKKTVESLKEIEQNRLQHLAQQGSQVIENERRRVLALKQRVQEEVRSQWAQKLQGSSSIASIESADIRDSITGSDEEGSILEGEPLKKAVQSEKSDPSVKPSTESSTENLRPLSDASDASSKACSTLGRRRAYEQPDKSRPLTRYLPIASSELDLRQHIESAGHQVVLCPHVTINSTNCRGFLHKKGSKLNGWSRRWFVFDRNRRKLVYYCDKSEKKPRGGAYFQAIEEVYLDHSNSIKSPNPHLTFILKTHQRRYYLMAPSPEAMRIWIDVIFTGAEGYQGFREPCFH